MAQGQRPRGSVGGLLTVRQATVELFGLEGTRSEARNLERRLKRKQEQLGVQLLFKLNNAEKSPWYVTEACLRDHMPELFSRRDATISALREALDDIREDLALCKMRDNALAARIRKLQSRLDQLDGSPAR